MHGSRFRAANQAQQRDERAFIPHLYEDAIQEDGGKKRTAKDGRIPIARLVQ